MFGGNFPHSGSHTRVVTNMFLLGLFTAMCDFIFDTKARNEKVSTEDLPQVIRELSILSLVFTYYTIMAS